jgi:hypothetical protein
MPSLDLRHKAQSQADSSPQNSSLQPSFNAPTKDFQALSDIANFGLTWLKESDCSQACNRRSLPLKPGTTLFAGRHAAGAPLLAG